MSRLRLFFEQPILRRELLGLLRGRGTFSMLFGAVVGASAMLAAGWMNLRAGPPRPHLVAQVYTMYLIAQLMFVLFILPATTAGAFAGEREKRTYDLLCGTLLAPFTIVVSKALSSIGIVLIYLVACAPAIGLLVLLGGVPFRTILVCYAVSFAAATTAVAVCLTVSFRCRRTAQSAVRGYVWTFFWSGGHALLGFLLQELLPAAPGWSRPIQEFLLRLSPFPAIASASWGGAAAGREMWVDYCICAAVIAALHFIYLFWRARAPEVPETLWWERLQAASRRRSQRRKRGSFASRLRTPLFLPRHGSSKLDSHPVFLREARHEFFGRFRFRALSFWAPFAVLAALVTLSSTIDERLLLPFLVGNVFSAVVLPAILAPSFAREVENRTAVLLASSLLRPHAILHGKFLAGLYGGAGFLLALLLALPLALLDYQPGSRTLLRAPLLLAMMWIMAVLAYLFIGAVAMLAATLTRSTVKALVLGYAALVVLFVGLPLAAALVTQNEEAVKVAGAINPFIAAAYTLHESNGYFFVFTASAGVSVLILWAAALACVEDRRRGPDAGW